MSSQEQRALMAWLNTYKLSKRITTFQQLADGQALTDVMNQIDASYFRNPVAKGFNASTSSPSSENWVIKMNVLKRLYRLLLSYPLPNPHPPNLSSTTLLEPPFAVIAKSPTTRDGSQGLLQICRLCVVAATWGPKNEDVIVRIQRLDEDIMGELMQSIELVTSSLPDDAVHKDAVPYTTAPRTPPPSSDPGEERSAPLQEMESRRSSYNHAIEQPMDESAMLDKSRTEFGGASNQIPIPEANPTADASALRTRHTSLKEAQRLRVELASVEDQLAQTQADLDDQRSIAADMTRTVDRLRSEAKDADKLKDQMDEYRYTAERLQKNENVVDKYNMKLADQAGLRRELRALEEQNAALLDTASTMEDELKRSGGARDRLAAYEKRLATLEGASQSQLAEMARLEDQLEIAHAQLADTHRASEREREELQLNQQRIRELELGSGIKRDSSSLSIPSLRANLGAELETGGSGAGSTQIELNMRIKALEREVAYFTGRSSSGFERQNDAVGREREVDDLKASSIVQGVPAAFHRRLLELYTRNRMLEADSVILNDRLQAQDVTSTRQNALASGNFSEPQQSHEAQIHTLQRDLEKARAETTGLEKRYRLEQQLMLSAWHDLGTRTVRDHMNAAVARRSQPQPMPTSWLGRQRRHQDDAAFSRT